MKGFFSYRRRVLIHKYNEKYISRDVRHNRLNFSKKGVSKACCVFFVHIIIKTINEVSSKPLIC